MLELARCHICAALLPDTPEDRQEHVSDHKHADKRLDAMTDSLRYLDGRITETNRLIADLREQLHGSTTAPADGLTINEFPDDEIDDTDPTAEGDADLAPTFDAVTTDLADLHDITTAPDDGLEARIATLNASGGPSA